MEFSMKLQPLPFSMIESGRKTIELRLYDEKRRLIAIGDTIRVLDISNPEKAILTEVEEPFIFGSFGELYRALPLTECGYTTDNVRSAFPKDMLKYYTREQEKAYGVIGIRIKVLQ